MKQHTLNSEELLESIFHSMSLLFEQQDFLSTIERLTDLGRLLVNCDRASFWFWDRACGQYWTMAALDNEKITVAEGTGIIGASIQNNKTIVINQPYEDERFNPCVDQETGYITRSIICIPVTNTDGDVIGAYQAINKLNEDGMPDSFEQTDVKRLTLVAVFGGKALESYLLYNKAFYDQLTGLKNRSGFYEIFHKRVLPSLTKTATSLVMCDIDYFKKVNDQYGHNGGDAMLVHIAKILHENIGIDDEAIRWGGEEFILVLVGKNIDQAKLIAEHIRKHIEETACEFEGHKINVTMSFGVKEVSCESPIEENIKKADEKLYEAKNTGRNKVV